MRTVFFKNRPRIIGASAVGGPKESQGELKNYLQTKLSDDMFGEKTYEKAECKMLTTAISEAIKSSKKKESDIDIILSGDLLNQIISASFSARSFKTGFLGVYNACASFTEALALGAMAIDGGYLSNVVCGTSSHFSSAERQYRYPLELGCTRPPQAQWTVTGAGATVLSKTGNGAKISCATFGRVVDYGINDVNNMGAAMAPAGADTLITHFLDTGLSPCDYDLIVTGDLGTFGSRLLKDIVWEKGFDIQKQHVDCGELVYSIHEEEYQGGSGAGCSAMVFNSYFYRKMKNKEYRRILFMATGALLSSTSSQQGETIPSIAHAVVIES